MTRRKILNTLAITPFAPMISLKGVRSPCRIKYSNGFVIGLDGKKYWFKGTKTKARYLCEAPQEGE